MSESRRMKRMGRNKKQITSLNLTSLMDVFTILVFFLLFNTGESQSLESPKHITLPESVVEEKPRETIVIMVGPAEVLVQGEAVIATADLIALKEDSVAAIRDRLARIERSTIGISTRAAVEGKEVTIVADRTIPFIALKKIMSTCTGSGYGKISLAVVQKASQS